MTKDNQVTAKVQGVLAAALNISEAEVTSELAFGDLPQWDSMGHMEVIVSLEEIFGIEVNAETISALVSIPAIVTHIMEMQNV